MTTIADTFTRANSSTSLGTASDGGLWTIPGGTFGILSNQAYLPAGGGSALGGAFLCAIRDTRQAVVDLSITVSRTATTGESALVFGYDPVAGSGYFLTYDGGASAHLRRFTNSLGQTTIANVFGPNPIGAGTVWRVTRDVSNLITVYANGVSQNSVTDSTYPSGTWVGFGSGATYATTGDTWDDFSAAATAAPPYAPPHIIARRRSSIVRASVI